MMSFPADLLLVFGAVRKVLRVERSARAQGLSVDAIPAPRAVSSECGVVLAAHREDGNALAGICAELGIEPLAVYHRSNGTWLFSSLHADKNDIDNVLLTHSTTYGGCGAKLAKGLLATVLCGLPRLESEDLLVGIEFECLAKFLGIYFVPVRVEGLIVAQ